jgi:hypothetical protein
VTKICFQVRLTHALGRSIFTVTIYYTGVEAARGDTHGSRIVTSAHIPALDNSLLDTSGRIYPSWNTVNRMCKALSSLYSADSSIFAVASFPRLQHILTPFCTPQRGPLAAGQSPHGREPCISVVPSSIAQNSLPSLPFPKAKDSTPASALKQKSLVRRL